jgi:hypothetical protein
MMEALAGAITGSGLWPADAPVLVQKPGDIVAEIDESLAKMGLCAVINEPDNIESAYGAADFATSSEWTVSVFALESLNPTGITALDAAGIIRTILSDSNPDNLWAESLGRCRVRSAGMADGVAARDVTFTAAYGG